MKTVQTLFAAALSLLLVALTSPLDRSAAQTLTPAKHVGAPGPVLGAGLPGLAIIGIGYGVYWLRKRRRRLD
jgi:hypothetical protein